MRLSLLVVFAVCLAACDSVGPDDGLSLDAPPAASMAAADLATASDGGTSSATTAAPVITAVGGRSDGVSTNNGRWTGQPMSNPRSNQYLGWLALETYPGRASAYTWTVTGSGFGTRTGTASFLLSTQAANAVSIDIVTWSDTRVVLRAHAPVGFGSGVGVFVLRTFDGQSVSRRENVMELVQTRGMGQCTYHVALLRVRANLAPPTTAYATTASVTSSYVPRQWDGLTFGNRAHVAIITSAPVKTIRDGTTTYTFTLSEMNAYTDEQVTTSTRTLVVRGSAVVQGIGTNASRSWTANGYFR